MHAHHMFDMSDHHKGHKGHVNLLEVDCTASVDIMADPHFVRYGKGKLVDNNDEIGKKANTVDAVGEYA